MVETRILRDKKNRRIIKMDKNKVDNNKYTYNIVDGEYSDNEGEQIKLVVRIFFFRKDAKKPKHNSRIFDPYQFKPFL